VCTGAFGICVPIVLAAGKNQGHCRSEEVGLKPFVEGQCNSNIQLNCFLIQKFSIFSDSRSLYVIVVLHGVL
jgi:hypothetical protein